MKSLGNSFHNFCCTILKCYLLLSVNINGVVNADVMILRRSCGREREREEKVGGGVV
jgi:hypothetical protein